MNSRRKTLVPGSGVTVSLIKEPRPAVRYPATVVRDDGNHVVVTAPWAGPPVKDFGAFRFERGDVFTEHYWRDRWFAVKEVHDAGGVPKGWYCDMTRPAEDVPGGLRVVDLELDLWVSADRSTVLRLDEDEFADSGLTGSDPEAAACAVRALETLESLALGEGFGALLR